MTTYGYQFPSFSSQARPYQYIPRNAQERELLRQQEIERKKQEFARQQAREPRAILQGYVDKAKGFADQADFSSVSNTLFGPLAQKIDDRFGPALDQAQQDASGFLSPYMERMRALIPQGGIMGQLLPPEEKRPPALLDRNNIKPDYSMVPPLLTSRTTLMNRDGRETPAPSMDAIPQMPMTDEERDAFRLTEPGKAIYGETDRKRDRTTFGEFLMNRPNLSDRLIRMGSAMQAASPRGLNAAMAAMGQAYTDKNAEIRAENLAALEAQQKAAGDNEDLFNDFQSQVFKYDKALEDFAKLEDSGIFIDLTGPIDGSIGSFLDSSGFPGTNPEREAFRIRLRKIIVDETLLNTANTKGAISDREMALFQSSVPTLKASEKVWIKWLTARRDNLIELQERIRSGRTVNRDDPVTFRNTYTIGSDSGSTTDGIPDDDEALFDF